MSKAEYAGSGTGNADGVDKSSDGSGNCGSKSEDQEDYEDEDFEAWW